MDVKTVNRIALVGLGSIGKRHLRLLKVIRPEVEVILVRSGYSGRCPEESLSSASVSSIEAAIASGIDGAIISSPAPYHVQQAIQFARAEVPLLIEKPLSHNLLNVRELKNLANLMKIPILVGYVLRHSEDLIFLSRLLTKKVIGSLTDVSINCSSYLPDWRPNQDYRLTVSAQKDLGGGALLELSHELDYANWLFGPFQSVQAALSSQGVLGIDVEDTADLTLSCSSGLKASIHLDFYQRTSVRQCVITGEKGLLVWDGLTHSVSQELNSGEVSKWSFSSDRDLKFLDQLKVFLSCIEDDAMPRVSLDDGVVVMELIEAARKSNLSGNFVDL